MHFLDFEGLQYYDGKIKTYFAKTYASLASPSFTGTPTSTTPSAGDSSTKIATTKYVQTELGTAKVASAGEFTAAKSVTLTGDVTGSASSKGGWSIAATLASSGVTADTYGPSANASPAHSGTFTVPKFTVDAKGRVTSASNITITLPSLDSADTKVTQTVTANTDEGKYPILAKNVTATATITDTSRFVDGITIQPSTGAVQAAKFIGALEGNASTATKLATARNINGTSFNGTSAITTATWGTARNISISDANGTNTGDAVSVNGSAAVTLKLPSTIKASLEGNASSADSVPWSGIDGKPSTFAPSSHNQASSTINAMTGYSKPSSTGAIAATDTLNAAIGKLEKALDGKQASGSYAAASHNHDASNINSGTLNAARIPNLDASKITSGTIDIARLPAGALERLVTVANQTARFALTTGDIQLGDTVRQSDTGLMYYVVDTSKLSSADGYVEYTAGAATSVPWSGVTGKPSTFAPSSHNQASSTINAMTGYSKPSSTSAIETSDTLNAAIGKLEKALDGKAASATTLAGYNISDAKIASGVITLGSNTITPLTSSSSLNAAKLTGTAAVNTTGNAATVTGTAGTSALSWNTETTLYTVGGHAIKAKLPANPNTDAKVRQDVGTTNTERPILSRYNVSDASQTAGYAVYDTGVTNNPNKHTLTASGGFVGKLSGTPEGTSFVAAVTEGKALVSATTTGYGGIWNAPTKNYRVGCSTYPSSGDDVRIAYSVTNANITDGTNTVAKSLTWNADSGTLTANAFSGPLTGNVTGNVSGSSGSCTGNAATATKLATTRSISAGDLEFQGSANFDGSGNVKLNITQHRSLVTVGNTNNYPFHRIAYTAVETGNYLDRAITFFIGKEFVSAGYGICRVILRTNNASSDGTAQCEVQWLARTSGIPVDAIQVGFNNTAKASYVDVFYKSTGTYHSAICRVMSHADSRTSVGQGFTVVSESTEASSTTTSDPKTSVESYATIAAAGTAIRGKAYTNTITASDASVVGSAASCTGNAATATKLATARAINGTNFDGSAAITTANWGTARNIYVADSDGTNTGAAVSVNGSANATLKLPATIKATITGNVSGSSGSCTGNAATATKLATARSLWGNNFDGSAAISGTITGTPSIEFKPTATTSNNGGYLDFHYNQSTADYTSRIIESASGTLSINNVTITTGKVVTATTFSGALSGNASSATITKGNKNTGSYVTSVKSGNALVNADNTQFATIYNAPTKSYRVGCATWPDNGDNIIWYSITNANVSSSTNTTNKTMTWNAGTGILTATGFAGPLTGNVTGNVSGSSGSCTGNAATATKLATARTINGVSFDGSANITVADSTKLPLAGGTMTGQITYKVGSITRGTAPSSSQYPWGIRMVDNASVALSGLYYEYLTDKTARTHLMCYQGTTNANTWKSIGIGYNTSGNPYTWSITPGFGDNSTQIATTEFVYKNAAKHLAAATSIYVAKAATGNGSGSNTSNYMSLADLRNYLATVHMHSSTADMNGSYTLTILFKAGDSFGNASFDAAKMPGIRNLVLNTSTGTASTTSNYSTNSPTFGNIAVTGDIAVTIRNINCTGRISAQYGAYVAVDTYVGLSSLHASNWAYVNVAKNMVIDVCDAHTDYLFAATNSGILAMWPGATVTINFRQQCYYTRCLFMSSTNGSIFVGYSSFKLTGTKPMMIWAGSGTLTGTSETAAGTAAKVVPLASGQTFTLATNATAKIRFTNDNTAANPTLNINSTGAKPIWWNGAAVAANMLAKNMTYDVKYDGTHYVIQNALKRLTNNDYGIFRSTGNYNQTYNSGSWNFDGYTISYGTGIENGNWRGNHIGNIEQRVTTGNNTYPILFSGTANATANTSTIPYFGSGVKINPSTSTVYATTFSGAFSGNVTGNCSGSSGSCTGNAKTATTLQTARKINGVSFNGSADITVADSTKLPLAGGTVTGATYFTAEYYRKDTGAVKGTAPSANRWQNGVRFIDNNNVAFGGIERGFLTDKTNRVNMIVYKGTTTDTSTNSQIGVGFDKDGNWFTYAPTPAAADNSTKIATTAWVRGRLHISTANPSGGTDGDIWFKYA